MDEYPDWKVQTIIVPGDAHILWAVDVSTSMDDGDGDVTGGVSRLHFVEARTCALLYACQDWFPSGVDMLAFGSKVDTYWGTTIGTLGRVFQEGTRGATNTTRALQAAYQRFKDQALPRGWLGIATDDVPDDRTAFRQAMLRIAEAEADAGNFSIHFFTVGQIADRTRDWLHHLATEMEELVGDICFVTVQPLAGTSFRVVPARAA